MFKKISKEEGVKVNQRHLVDKILARYSTEFVVYRELMQNSDDVKSSKVEIIFESTGKNIAENKVITIIFKNNGSSFDQEGWERIRTIALGNPDERKIGAFGVGFYSIFSVCDEPYVMSNGHGMKFFWNGDQLRTKFGKSKGEDLGWTTFEMKLRNSDRFPDVEKFARFLANSLVFMNSLSEVTVYFNKKSVISLSKKLTKPQEMDITSGFHTYSPNKIFQLSSLNIRDIQIDVERLVQKESSESLTTDSIVLKITNGKLKITADKEYSNEMKRITKKEKLPNDTPVQMIFYAEDCDKKISTIFKDLFPYPEQGRVYIGFSTHQTTGCCSNLSSLLVPSVERVSIDLVNKTLREYNIGIISLAGLLCRIFYEREISKIKKDYNKVVDVDLKDNVKNIENNYKHVLRYFTFDKSTPEESVGEVIEKQFFDCLERKLEILSTCGIFPITDVRIPNSRMERFIKTVPVVPKIVYEYCKPFFEKAKDAGFMKELSFSDVKTELESRSLPEAEVIALLKWWISYMSEKNNESEFSQFMQLATVYIRDKHRPLNTIHYILNPHLIPPNVAIPDDVLPYNISKNFANFEIMEEHFKWVELPLIIWSEFIVDHTDVEVSPAFAEKVHKILSKNLYNINKDDRDKIHQLFVDKKCIPTTHGMKKPEETYFKNDDLPSNLPVIQFQDEFDFQNLMIILGVNKVIKINDMMNYVNEVNYDHMKIAKYFGSILSDLDQDYLEELKTKKIWPADGQNNETRCFVANELHTPSDSNRELSLSIIKWSEKWDHQTNEAKFLIRLGLQDYPSLLKVLELSTRPTEIRNKALEYFIENFEKKYSHEYDVATINFAFLPCSKGVYAKPSECFINSHCAVMEFDVISEEYKDHAEKLGVRRHPGHEKLIKRLIENIPQNEDKAKEIFEYLATQKNVFTESELDTLSATKFIPTCNNVIHKSPRDCFFKGQGKMEEMEEIMSSSSVDFGKRANEFLQICGVKNEPSAIKIAELLVESSESSRKVWESIGKNVEKYKSILQKLAEGFNNIEDDQILFTKLKENPILLGAYKGDEEKYRLDSAGNIYINDDEIYPTEIYQNLLTVPKGYPKFLYEGLGCKPLSESIEEEVVVLVNSRETSKSQDLAKLLKERACFFYINHPSYFVKRDEGWLKLLKVVETDKIEIQYSLKNKNKDKTMPATAYISEDKESGIFTLYITPEQDFFDISKNLVKHIYKSRKLKVIKDLKKMLETPIEDLEDFKNDLERRNRFKHKDLKNNDKVNLNQDPKNNPQLDDLFKSLNAMFPDCEPNYIRQCLEQEKEDKLINVENRLMEGGYPQIKIPVNPHDPPNTVKVGKTFMNVIQISRHNLGSYLKKNQITYCNIIEEDYVQFLKFEGFLDGIEFHIHKNINDTNKSDIFKEYQGLLDNFVNILKELIEVFDCVPKFIHVFYDTSNLMAFNQDYKLFFNFKTYLDLYKTDPKFDALTYWYMVICHELAHKLVADHNDDYTHHLSSITSKYMKNLLEIMNKRNKEI